MAAPLHHSGERRISHHIVVDFTRDHDPTVRLSRLVGVEIVINAVGILHERGVQTFDALHAQAPIALFSACRQAQVARVIQISALGADEQAHSHYHTSKKTADDFLRTLDLDWIIVQPSLVYGTDGASAALFRRLAVLPWIPLPGTGAQIVQPIHIDDLAAVVVALVAGAGAQRRTLACVGPVSLSWRQMLVTLRAGLNLAPARFVSIPLALVRLAAHIGAVVPGALLRRETLAMLERGNHAPADAVSALLGRAPRAVAEFINPANAALERGAAHWYWAEWLLRSALALVWIVTGVLALGVYPRSGSYHLLARVGASGIFASVLLYGAAALDLALGMATLWVSRGRWLWRLQIGLIGMYSLIIAWRLPEFWLHPFGPLLKNIPILAILAVLLLMGKR
ncbi:MAG: SDR family oxidoreductase [Gammaproteobacteria bacterium]